MANPPVTANIDFDPDPPSAQSLCGFKFPTFNFTFGFNIPALPKCLVDPLSCLPIPYLSLSCDLGKPIEVGWGGGKEPNVDPINQEQDPFA